MMKRFAFLFLLPLVLLASVSCGKEKEPAEDTVLIYLAGKNTLASQVSSCIRQLEEGYLPATSSKEKTLLLYVRNYDENPILMKLSRDDDGAARKTILFHYPSDQNAAKAETLERVLRDVDFLFPAKRRGLVLWSHSSGWIPCGYTGETNPEEPAYEPEWGMPLSPGRVTSFAQEKNADGSFEIDIRDLAEALPMHYDYIIFDSCQMGCVEVAYELRDKCDYVAFSPSEVMNRGFPYYMMMERLLGGYTTEKALTDICEEYYNYYLREYNSDPWAKGGTISLIDTREMDALCTEFGKIVESHADKIRTVNTGDIQRYYRGNHPWFFDLEDLVLHVADETECRAFHEALQKCSVYRATTPGFILGNGGYYINHYSGLSTFIPKAYMKKLNEYYITLKWDGNVKLVEKVLNRN